LACSIYLGEERCIQGKLGGKRPLGRPRIRWEDNVNMNLQEAGWEGMDRIVLDQNRTGDEVMNLRVP